MGSSGSLISKGTVDQLGWKIDRLTKLRFNIANGNTGTPLGKIRNAAVKVRGAMISVNFIVINAKTYDLILENDWIDKVKAVIDVHQGKAKIKWKGRRWLIPIDIHKGIAPRKIESKEESYLMQDAIIQYKKIDPKALQPEQKTQDSARFDLSTMTDVVIPPCEVAVVNTGVAIEVPKGFVRIVKARSSLTKLGLGVEGGVIDADYRGEIKTIMANQSKIHE